MAMADECIESKLCPFCGAYGTLRMTYKKGSSKGYSALVKCTCCGATTYGNDELFEEPETVSEDDALREALDKWNSRVPECENNHGVTHKYLARDSITHGGAGCDM